MWLNALDAPTHRVYFGTNKAAVAMATPTSPQHRENVSGNDNVHYLTGISLASGSTYYWRVDAVIDPSTMYKGDVWSFQIV